MVVGSCWRDSFVGGEDFGVLAGEFQNVSWHGGESFLVGIFLVLGGLEGSFRYFGGVASGLEFREGTAKDDTTAVVGVLFFSEDSLEAVC